MKTKNLLTYFLIFLSFSFLIGCSNNANQKNDLVIKPSEFSKETNTILELFDEEIMFFDFDTDESVKTVVINTFSYNGEEWVEIGEFSSLASNNDNQVALKISDSEYEIILLSETGHSKYSSPKNHFSLLEDTSLLSTSLTNPTEIEIDKEILLYLKITSDEYSISTPNNFRDANCTSGISVTITFLDTEI